MAVLVLNHGAITPLGGGEAWAVWREGNPLGARTVEVAKQGRTAMWSGWLEWEEEGESGVDPRTWGAAGWVALERVMGEWAAGAGAEVCVRTHHAHVLSDVPSCLRFAQRWEQSGVKLIVDVGAMIAPSMLAAAADHAARVLEALGSHPAVAAVVVSLPGAEGEPAPLHAPEGGAGVWGEKGAAGELVELIGRHVPPERPLVLLGGEVERQVRLLAGVPHLS